MRIENADYQNVHAKALNATAYLIVAGLVVGGIRLFGGPIVLDVHAHDFNPIVLMPLIVSVGALLYAASAGRAWLWARWFRTSVLEVDAVVAGERLHGVLRTAFDVRATAPFAFRLQCIKTRTVIYGKESTVVDDVLGEWTQSVQASGDPSIVGIPFDFSLPGAMPPTGVAGGGTVRWALICSARRAGLNYHAVFPIPVEGRPTHQHGVAHGALGTTAEPL
jgi:hypothetical protein